MISSLHHFPVPEFCLEQVLFIQLVTALGFFLKALLQVCVQTVKIIGMLFTPNISSTVLIILTPGPNTGPSQQSQIPGLHKEISVIQYQLFITIVAFPAGNSVAKSQ